MELIDIIKSSILFFCLLILIIITVSFSLFKIRNQAKRKKMERGSHSKGEKLNKDDYVVKSVDKKQLQSDVKADTIKPLFKKNVEKFVVVNNKTENLSHKATEVNYHPKVYKFYQEFNSKVMFKIKAEDK